MTEIRCPGCGAMNRLSALHCAACSMPFSSLPAEAFVTTVEPGPVYEPGLNLGAPPLAAYQRSDFDSPPMEAIENELGKKTFFWYRVYCGTMTALYMLVAAAGATLAFLRPPIDGQSPEETLIMGVVYGILGAVFFLAYLVAFLLPAKPYNWIVGLVMIAIGMTSCCMWPVVIPLLVFWIKPETRRFFGRK